MGGLSLARVSRGQAIGANTMMTLAQLKAAIKAIDPMLTFRVTDGEARISVNPVFIRLHDDDIYTYQQSLDRSEGMAIYEDCKDAEDRECVLANAKHLFGYYILPRLKAAQ
jgi:hypothetical protein